jgi:hypothetical protein
MQNVLEPRTISRVVTHFQFESSVIDPFVRSDSFVLS